MSYRNAVGTHALARQMLSFLSDNVHAEDAQKTRSTRKGLPGVQAPLRVAEEVGCCLG